MKKAAFIVVIFLVQFALAELAARAIVREPLSMLVPSSNPRLIYELRPSYQDVNSLGMRQEELNVPEIRKGFVIAAIGDSHTYGARATRERTFPARLQQHLHDMTGRDLTALNLGVPGYDMAQELEVLRARALQFEPDMVILQYCANDEHISNWIQPKYVGINRTIHSSILVSASWKRVLYSRYGQKYLLPYVEDFAPDLLLFSPGLVGTSTPRESDPAHRMFHTPRTPDRVPPRYHDFIGRANLVRDVGIFGDIGRSHRIPMLATGFIEDRDRSLYTRAGMQVLSYSEIFAGKDMRDYGYDPADPSGHFDERGSEVIGATIAEFIKQRMMK